MKLPNKIAKNFYATPKSKSRKGAKSKSVAATASPAARSITASPNGEPSYCEYIAGQANEYQRWKCEGKANAMTPVGDAGECPCSGDDSGGGSVSSGVDLVVLIDSSSSMRDSATIISDIAPRAFELARASCGAVAKVTYLYVDSGPREGSTGDSGSDPASQSFVGIFDTSHERYLIDVAGYSGPFLTNNDGGYDGEQGGKAISDLSYHFNWTPGYCRAILYISDESLSSSQPWRPTVADSQAAANIAIAGANANNVAIFSHYANGGGTFATPDPDRDLVEQQYRDMSDQTGGYALIDETIQNPSAEAYTDLIARAICEGCGNSAPSCTTVPLPELEPCVSISWGDSECDCMEGDDHEEICISICNCYDNVTFKNVRIGGIVITDEDGRMPPRLPDDSPSSELYSVGPYCFGDIGPCVDGTKSCVTRNAVIINRGLPPGTWKVRMIGLCFDVVHHYDEREMEFAFDVCKN